MSVFSKGMEDLCFGLESWEMPGSFKVSENLKINAITSYKFITYVLTDWLDKLPLSEFRKVIFTYYKVPLYAAKRIEESFSHWESKRKL